MTPLEDLSVLRACVCIVESGSISAAARTLKVPQPSLRLFATIDFGQFTVTRLIARFLHANPGVTAELGYANRPLHMI